jgi:hypothetical protein
MQYNIIIGLISYFELLSLVKVGKSHKLNFSHISCDLIYYKLMTSDFFFQFVSSVI